MVEPFERRERRGFPRAGMSVLIQVQIVAEGASLDDGLGGSISGLSMDVSRGGVVAWLGREVPEGADCVVRFVNGRRRLGPVLAGGVVRRVERRNEGFVVGIELVPPLEFLRLAEPDDRAPDGRPVRALVVEDEAAIRNLLARFFARRGFDVDTAANGEEALEIIRAEPPDVLVIDLYMPKVSGHEVLRRLRESDIDVGVICTISGHASDDDARECLRLGAAEHLPKPLDLQQLDWSIRLRLDAGREVRR